MTSTLAIVTGTRADFGLLRPLLGELKKRRAFDLRILATGMHLSPEFGLTYREIEESGFQVHEKVEMLLSSDSDAGITKSTGLGIIGFADAYERLRPQGVILLGDRFETFAAATAAYLARIPIIHIHGGEVTQGAFDDGLRHSITKMAHLHFTAAEEYRRRVIQLGEAPERVFNVGALGIDNIRHLKLLSRRSLEKQLNLALLPRNLLVTFHPATLEGEAPHDQFLNLLTALDQLTGTMLIFSKANADTGGRGINGLIERFVTEHPETSRVYDSLGYLRYLSLMQFVDGVVGNSSSGIIEAPSFRIGTVNIGSRQDGRVRAESIIDCPPSVRAIGESIERLYSSDFRRKLRSVVNPHGDGNAAEKIVRILAASPLGRTAGKPFHDIIFEPGE